MTSFRLRPRFQHSTPHPPEEVQQMIAANLESASGTITGNVDIHYIVLKIPLKDRHYWSPQLNLTLEPLESGTKIYGLYGPNPTVWAMFFFSYAAIGILALFISIIGFSQWALGLKAGILWFLPVLGGLAVILYLTAQLGQKKGAEQTFTLHQFYENTIHKKIHIV